MTAPLVPFRRACAMAFAAMLLCGCGGFAPVTKSLHLAPNHSQRFVVISDTHFGSSYCDMLEANRQLVRAIHAYPGAKPEQVLICGDLTHAGTPAQWEDFLSVYGPAGEIGLPVQLCTGNHDRRTPDNLLTKNSVVKAVMKRNGGLRHRWTHGGVTFFNLDNVPTLESMLWLDEQLTTLGPDTPAIVMIHVAPVDLFSKMWTTPREERVYENLMRKHLNILAVFHGHMHYTNHTRLGGVDHFSPGSPKGRDAFLVVDISPSGMTVTAAEFKERSPITFKTVWTGKVKADSSL